MKKTFVVLLALVLLPALASASPTGTKKRRPLPYEYGRAIMTVPANEKPTMPDVKFDHWLHRAKFTCRLCHVDIGFAMKTNGSSVKQEDIAAGYYCGVCHNGKPGHDGKAVFRACENKYSQDDVRARCKRCHSVGEKIEPAYNFAKFTEGLPKARFGNGVDWEQAEISGLVKPVDYIEGTSFKRQAIKDPKDLDLISGVKGMPEIIFSHKKHTTWNGCEGCHPEIFKGVKQGSTTYSMLENYDGKYCGQCHLTVAFPMTDCQRCHSKPVE
jgi:c(7)-type cytochrome triheme protein